MTKVQRAISMVLDALPGHSAFSLVRAVLAELIRGEQRTAVHRHTEELPLGAHLDRTKEEALKQLNEAAQSLKGNRAILLAGRVVIKAISPLHPCAHHSA